MLLTVMLQLQLLLLLGRFEGAMGRSGRGVVNVVRLPGVIQELSVALVDREAQLAANPAIRRRRGRENGVQALDHFADGSRVRRRSRVVKVWRY